MYRKVSLMLACLWTFIIAPSAEGARAYEEGYFPVGTSFSLNQSETIYSVSDHTMAELYEKAPGVYAVRCVRPGDVYITAYTKLQGRMAKFVMLAHIAENETARQVYSVDRGNPSQERFAEEILRFVNAERGKVGAMPLRMASDLMHSADIRAEEITRYYSHTRPDGRSCFTVVKDTNRLLGENIAAGYTSAAEVVKGWMESQGHRENILNPNFREIGIGYRSANTEYKHYWVQIFRR